MVGTACVFGQVLRQTGGAAGAVRERAASRAAVKPFIGRSSAAARAKPASRGSASRMSVAVQASANGNGATQREFGDRYCLAKRI